MKTVCKINAFNPTLKYNIIIMSHVLEHLEFPQNCIKNFLDNLESDGILFIEAPSETSNLYHFSYSVEPYITFFTLKILKNFIEKYFKHQLEIVYAGTADLVRTDNISANQNIFCKIWISFYIIELLDQSNGF